jgi:hypothetical protein
MTISDCSICLLFDNNSPLATKLSTSSFYRLLSSHAVFIVCQGNPVSYSRRPLEQCCHWSGPRAVLSLVRTKSSVVTGLDQEQCCHWSGPRAVLSLVRTKSSVVTGLDQEQCCHWSGPRAVLSLVPASYLHCKCRSLIQSCMLPHAIPSPIHCNENAIYVFPEKELRGLSSNFYIYVSVSDLYIHRIRTHIFLQQNR